MGNWFQRLWDKVLQRLDERLDVENWSRYAGYFLDSVVILLLAAAAIWLVRRLLTRVETRIERVRGTSYRRRIETITSLAGSTAKYVVYIAAAISILALWGAIDQSSVAFGSAAVGAAIGFGSQGLVQDVITGLSILAEDQLAVGDYVEVGGKAGVVEEIGLRVIKLRDHLGVQHVIFNRTIATVSNFTTGAMQAVVDVSLEKMEDAEAARRIAVQVARDLAVEVPHFPDVPDVIGVQQSSTKDIFLRIKLRVLPQQQQAINDLFVDRIKRAFAAEKINIPEGRVRVVIVSDLFHKAVNRVKPSALPSGAEKIFDGAV